MIFVSFLVELVVRRTLYNSNDGNYYCYYYYYY